MDHDPDEDGPEDLEAAAAVQQQLQSLATMTQYSAFMADYSTVDMRDTEEVQHCVHAAMAATQEPSFMSGYGVGGYDSLEDEHQDDALELAEEDVRQAVFAIRQQAARYVSARQGKLPTAVTGSAAVLQPLVPSTNNPLGIRSIIKLNTTLLPVHQVVELSKKGVTLFEPFGGLAVGAEMLLRNGVPIQRYIYADTSPAAQKVAKHRLQRLSDKYGEQLFPTLAWQHAFTTLPQNVYDICNKELLAAGVLDGSQWMVVAGWECQDLSPAGSGKGLAGNRSHTFYPLVQIVGTMQQLQKAKPPAFIFENTAMKFPINRQTESVQANFREICNTVGNCVEIDELVWGLLRIDLGIIGPIWHARDSCKQCLIKFSEIPRCS